jgi:hypothetical protein
MQPRRMWINQPSTSQPEHGLHGCNVLAVPEVDGEYFTVYFLTGPIVSTRVSKLSLSEGWKEEPVRRMSGALNSMEMEMAIKGQRLRAIHSAYHRLGVSIGFARDLVDEFLLDRS